MKRPVLAALVALAVALPATAGAATAPTISITSPVSGDTFSRSFFESIPVSGVAAFDAPVAEDRTFYLRGSGCGATESFWLSITSGTDEYDGCGIIGGLPVNELIHLVDGPTPNSFPAQDGLPVLLDASKDVTGQIRAESWFGDGIPGVGQVVIEVALSGTNANNQHVAIGSDTMETVNSATDGVNLAFSFDIPANLDRVALKDLNLDVEVHGMNWNSGNLGLSGDSKFTLPIFDAGRIDVSADSASFAASKTVQATMKADGTWTAEITTPSTGSRKIYARAVQAGVTTNAIPVSITVTA